MQGDFLSNEIAERYLSSMSGSKIETPPFLYCTAFPTKKVGFSLFTQSFFRKVCLRDITG